MSTSRNQYSRVDVDIIHISYYMQYCKCILQPIILFCTFSGKQVQDHLVVPLLSSVSELSRQKKELVGIIKKKDLEIQNYKEEGASLSRSELLVNVLGFNSICFRSSQD